MESPAFGCSPFCTTMVRYTDHLMAALICLSASWTRARDIELLHLKVLSTNPGRLNHPFSGREPWPQTWSWRSSSQPLNSASRSQLDDASWTRTCTRNRFDRQWNQASALEVQRQNMPYHRTTHPNSCRTPFLLATGKQFMNYVVPCFEKFAVMWC